MKRNGEKIVSVAICNNLDPIFRFSDKILAAIREGSTSILAGLGGGRGTGEGGGRIGILFPSASTLS